LSLLHFKAPPLPHFIMCGEDTYQEGRTHLNRHQIGVFDLLIVTQGCLFFCESDTKWMVTPGKVLILRPDLHHYSYKACTTQTHFFWIHFQYLGDWTVEHNDYKPIFELQQDPYKTIYHFSIILPKFCELANPWNTYQHVRQLLDKQHYASTQWEQQVIFHQIIMDLHSQQQQIWNSQVYQLAEKTAAYLRENFQSPINSDMLRKDLLFHPTYLARCMKDAFGCTPLEYLTDYRVSQAKILLMNSDMPVQMIAQKVGFNSSTYFIRSFIKLENETPAMYRKKFRKHSSV
jgi:AraC-like DNA-binding protein